MQSIRASVRLALLAVFYGTLASPRFLEGQAITPRRAADTWRLGDSTAVAAALSHFLTAFENLDWAPFRASFSDSATIFQPAPEMPERVTGPRGIDSTFRAVFANIRSHAIGGPPYQRLVPIDLRIQPLSPGLVLVTFELRNAERLARRTVVFRRESIGWRILHLHASNVAIKR
jgi:ketosteroid isomerase-like protein